MRIGDVIFSLTKRNIGVVVDEKILVERGAVHTYHFARYWMVQDQGWSFHIPVTQDPRIEVLGNLTDEGLNFRGLFEG